MNEQIKKELEGLTLEQLEAKELEINSIPMIQGLTEYQSRMLAAIRKLLVEAGKDGSEGES